VLFLRVKLDDQQAASRLLVQQWPDLVTIPDLHRLIEVSRI
jgi:hypothetical protein